MAKVCVVGGGRWGQNHIKTLKLLGHDVSVVDPVITADYTDLADVELDEFDAFTVVSPSITHFQIGEYLLSHDKPVLIEKPVVMNESDAERLVSYSATLMAGHLYLFHPAIQKIKEMLPELGAIQFIHSKRLNFGNIRTEEDVIWGSMPHDVYIIDYLMDGAEPLSVTCDAREFIQRGIYDGATATLVYSDTTATIHANWLWPTKEVGLVVICEQGAFTFDLKELALYRNSVSFDREGKPVLCAGEKEVIPYHSDTPLMLELDYFLAHIDGGCKIAGKENILQTTHLLQEISDAS